MLTRIRDHAARSRAGRTWLLALVVAGIVGMHGLSAGAAHAVHPEEQVARSASATATTAHHTLPAPTGDEDSTHDASLVMLCVVMVLALALGMTGLRRTTWVASLARARARLTLPAAPLLRDRTPVPRFTVMRC